MAASILFCCMKCPTELAFPQSRVLDTSNNTKLVGGEVRQRKVRRLPRARVRAHVRENVARTNELAELIARTVCLLLPALCQ